MLGLIQDEIEIKKNSSLWADSVKDLKMHYIQIDELSPVKDTMVKDIHIPDEAILITILRGDEAIVPRGNTIIKDKDTIIALANSEAETELNELLTGESK